MPTAWWVLFLLRLGLIGALCSTHLIFLLLYLLLVAKGPTQALVALCWAPGRHGHVQAPETSPVNVHPVNVPPLSPPRSQVFGNASFRSRQRDIVEAALSGRNCFVLMPTGGEPLGV